MIWLLGIGLAIAVSLYLIAPFIARDGRSVTSAEVSSYRDELRAIAPVSYTHLTLPTKA